MTVKKPPIKKFFMDIFIGLKKAEILSKFTELARGHIKK